MQTCNCVSLIPAEVKKESIHSFMNSFKVKTAFIPIWRLFWLAKTLALDLKPPTCCEAAAAITRWRIRASLGVTDNHFPCQRPRRFTLFHVNLRSILLLLPCSQPRPCQQSASSFPPPAGSFRILNNKKKKVSASISKRYVSEKLKANSHFFFFSLNISTIFTTC